MPRSRTASNMNLKEPTSSNEKQATVAPVSKQRRAKRWLTVREMTVFSMLGAILFCSKLLMEWAPNIHFIAMFLIVFTMVYRVRALVPLYVFVLLTGVYAGFNVWWVPYLYIWLPVFGLALLIPRKAPKWAITLLSMLIGGVHGILYGVLYAPAQAFFFKMDFQTTVAWVLSGTVFDILHAVGNVAACALTVPLFLLLSRLEKQVRKGR